MQYTYCVRMHRLWAEIFEVREEGGRLVWGRVWDEVVPVNVICIQDSPVTVYQITAYDQLVKKIFDVQLCQPGRHEHNHSFHSLTITDYIDIVTLYNILIIHSEFISSIFVSIRFPFSLSFSFSLFSFPSSFCFHPRIFNVEIPFPLLP
jgi:hypothetical protein